MGTTFKNLDAKPKLESAINKFYCFSVESKAEASAAAEMLDTSTELKKDALAEAMEAVTGDLLGDVTSDDTTNAKTAASPQTDDATDADMDGASALAALASAAVAVDESKKPANGVTAISEITKLGSDVDQHGVTAEERRRDVNWFDVGIIKGTSCTVSSYYLPSGGEQDKTDIDVEREDILKKLDLQVRI